MNKLRKSLPKPVKKAIRKPYYFATHLIGKLKGTYYFEDNVRVYENVPDRNYLNHSKVYHLASQFVKNKRCIDVGCGSGYGSKILLNSGASAVSGIDASEKALNYAKSKYKDDRLEFRQMFLPKTDYPDNTYDFCICTEVLEHLKEYGKHEETIVEINRITKPGGIIILATPNSELLGDHGFYYDELFSLMGNHFINFLFFENSFIPKDKSKNIWIKREKENRVGLIFTKSIKLNESVTGELYKEYIKKSNVEENIIWMEKNISLQFLHNTHSFVVIALNA